MIICFNIFYRKYLDMIILNLRIRILKNLIILIKIIKKITHMEWDRIKKTEKRFCKI